MTLRFYRGLIIDDLIAGGAIDGAADVARSTVGLAVRPAHRSPTSAASRRCGMHFCKLNPSPIATARAGPMLRSSWQSLGSPRQSRPRSNSPADRSLNSWRGVRPNWACSRSSPSCRLRARIWSARCRLRYKTSLSTPPGCRRAPPMRAATAFLVFMRAEQAKQLMRANGLDPA